MQSIAAEQELTLRLDGLELKADLSIPEGAGAIVLFAHGSGSGRKSTRNRFVAAQLNRHGLGAFLLDLLTLAEEREDIHTAAYRFDIRLLAGRLRLAAEWLWRERGDFQAGFFGASTGAAAALIAAADLQDKIGAVVSRGGRPDLAGMRLKEVTAPTLLIVGGEDHGVIGLNEKAFEQLRCEKDLVIVPGATHLFEEPGALEQVADLAAAWFGNFMRERV